MARPAGSNFCWRVGGALDGQLVAQPVIFGQQVVQVAQARGNLVEHRARQVRRHVLRQGSDAEALLAGDFPVVRLEGSVDQAQQIRFAGRIASQQADPLAALDLQVRPHQQRRTGETERHVTKTQQCHGGSFITLATRETEVGYASA